MASDWYGNTVVYTSVVTDFEWHGLQHFTEGVDYRYITDGLSSPHDPSRWTIEVLPKMEHLHPRRVAKMAKCMPWYFPSLQRYKYAIWIDGDMQILRPQFVPELLHHLNNGLVISPHFDNRHCAYGEAGIKHPKYDTEPLAAQTAAYRAAGFPEEFGLYEGGILGWDMTNPDARSFGYQWFIENMVWSYQDQVSLPYVLWKTGFKPDVLPQSFRDMDWVLINAHKSEF